METIQAELKHFAAQKSEWLKNHRGKFVLVKGEELIGVFDAPESALSEGARRFGLEPFLIRRVATEILIC